ncbi:MAG: choice-of-anchor Q domain-containing protein [Actinomycetota bacterium]
MLGAGTYTLSIPGTGEDAAADGDLDVTDPLVIRGTGSGNTFIDGGGATTNERAFHVLSSLDISMVTIQNSVSPTGFAGIYGQGAASSLTITDAVVSGHTNTASTGGDYGSGINSEGTLTLTNVISRNNSSPMFCCSGIFHFPAATTGPFTARNVTSVDNTDLNCCSGMYVDTDDPVVIENVNVSRNISADSCCTGIYLDGPGTATIRNATVADNQAQGTCCAGIYNGEADLTLENVTVSGNVTIDCCAGITHDTTGMTLTANNLTVTGNRANTDNTGSENGAGISNFDGTVLLRNSISSGNTIGAPGVGPDCFGPITSQGHNLIGTTADCTFTTTTGDIIGQDPRLGPLADNGGLAGQTHALLAGSPAIDAGDPAIPGSGGTACAATDQRGLARNCDIGAYELVMCATVPVNRIGTAGDNTLTGTDGPDGFLAGDGNDTATGLGGDDAFCMEGGDDNASGGGGNDLILGAAGNDTSDGGDGDDLIQGGDGDDTGTGGAGNDQILGEAGNDIGDGGEGNDTFLGGDGNDLGKGGAGKDLLKGQKGKDRLNGGKGKDRLVGGGGKDRLNCGGGRTSGRAVRARTSPGSARRGKPSVVLVGPAAPAAPSPPPGSARAGPGWSPGSP